MFGEPIERDGVTIIPVFRVSGGGGGGGSTDRGEGGQGYGGGMRFTTRPVGVYVLREGNVCWKPAVDVSQAVIAGATVLITALATIRSLVRGAVRP